MIVKFQDTKDRIFHDVFQEWRRINQEGFFINCKSKNDIMLHFVVCQHPGSAEWSCDDDGYHSLTKKMKVCSTDREDLEQWARENYTAKLKFCSDCDPMSRDSGISKVNVYFFLWNPKKDPRAFRDYDKVQSDALSGWPYLTRWICPATGPRPGDIAIMQRTGNRNNGVFAKGTVTSKPYENGRVRVVDLKLDSFLPIGEEIPREEIVEEANYKKRFMPMASGNIVPEQITGAILSLWNERIQPPDEQASDLAEPRKTERVLCVTKRIIRDTPLARRIKKLHNNKCQLCGSTLTLFGGESYAEAHHIKPLGSVHHGPDVAANIICVCPNCHALLDYGAIGLDKSTLRLAPKHHIKDEYINYHNNKIYKGAASTP